MDKKKEREKIAKLIASDNFISECEKQGFTACSTSEEGTGKKKANL